MIATSTAPMTPAAKASLMAGQTKQRDQLRDALNDQTQDFRLVLVNATGGMGKTRILEEVLARVNHPNEKWHKDGVEPWPEFEKQDRVIVSDLIDVIDTRLHDRTRFITELHNSLRSYSRIDPGIEFRNYRDAEDELRRSSASGVQLVALRDAQDNAAKSFVEDLRMLTDGPNGRRVAVIIDTVERLSYELIDLPYNCGLLPLEAIESRTHVWLAELIKNEKLQNVTLILAGRAEEGEGFFNWIKEAAKTRGIDPLPIELSVLSVDETKEFFQDLEDDFKKDPRAEDPEVKHIAEHFAMMAEDADRLYRYTRGVPVVLSLYGQVIRETATVSRYLTMDSAEALKLAGLEGTSKDTGLQFLRWLIEDSFVDELLKYADFRPEDVSKELAREEELTKPHKSFETRRRILRARVLLALIRAPRGLTAEQLHYALDSSDDDSPESWRPDQDKLREYVEVLKQIESEFLGKRRSSWEEFAHLFKDAGPAESSTYRVGLQDEIYRIFAEHRGLAADPPTPTVEPIRELLMGYRGDVFRRRLGEEREERRRFYRKLGRWADWRHKKLLAAKRRLLELDEKEFETDLRLTVPASYNFRELNGLEVRDRSALNWAITLFEIERMVYELLDNPEWSLNTSYITLEDDNDKAAREEEDFLAQAEMWRTLNDDFLMKFVPLTQRKIVTERRDKPIDVLRRVAEQESIARWIKRFALRGEYKRAIKFSEDIEEWINDPVRFPELSWECVKRKKADSGNGGQGQLSPAPPIKYVWDSWRHTVATGERLVWKNVAVIRQGRADEAIAAIEGVLEELRERYHRQRDYVFEIGDRIEYGFKAVEDAAEADPNRFDHPGRARLKRLFSHIENTLGYAYSRKGEYQRAVEHYAGGLFYIQNERDLTRPDEAVVAARDEKILMPAHRAKLLNNAARAHSEIWNPSTEMCLDGLAIRREVAEEIPIAGSLNTLALIYDDLGRYEDAPLLSAKSIAYCRRARESRQLGFSLRQMAETLRHLADRIQTGQRTAMAPEDFFSAAENLLSEARAIFTTKVPERDRLLEIDLEIGSLYRDRMNNRLLAMTHEEQAGRRFPGAGDADFEEYLAYAVETLSALLRPSESLRPHLRADAHINLARVYYLEERYYSRRARANVDGTVPRPDHDPAGLHAQAEVARNRALHELAQVEELAGHLTIRGEDRDDLAMSQLLPDLLGEKWESKSERQRNDLRNRSWVFRELCIASLVRGEMALDDFEQFNERMKSGDLSPGRKVYMKNFRQIVGRLRNVRRFEAGTSGNGRQAYDISMHKALAGMSPDRDTTGAVNAALGAARAFGLAVRYGELLSPRSWLLIASRNAFYRRVKTYSVEQLELLDVALRIVSSSPEYEKVASFGVLKRTLRDYFGYDAQSGANREI